VPLWTGPGLAPYWSEITAATSTATTTATTGIFAAAGDTWWPLTIYSNISTTATTTATMTIYPRVTMSPPQRYIEPLPLVGAPTPLVHTAREREEQRERRIARSQAQDRARTLLLSFLSPDQRRSLEANNAFIITAASGQRYRIRPGTIGNVDVLAADNDNQKIHSLCFHQRNYLDVPVEDVMLAQMLHLLDDEESVKRIANVHRNN
jgi:hypothetical protein